MNNIYIPESKEEKEFLENYDPDKYQKPSVTTDIVIFTVNDENKLSVLLIKRGGFPYKGKWAIPGGFVGMDEGIDEAASRELMEETNLKNIPIEQFGTFGDVGRDPRMRVISIAYMAFIPKSMLKFKAGDDAADAKLFSINFEDNKLIFKSNDIIITEDELAFDHKKVINTAILRLRNRIDYTFDAFKFLKNKNAFTVSELRNIFETVKCEKIDAGNFNRDFKHKFVKTNIVEPINKVSKENSKRGAMLYKYNG